MPANRPVTRESTRNSASRGIWDDENRERFFPESFSKTGIKNSVMTREKIKAINAIKRDSPKNRLIRDFRSAPSTLRTPTSTERLDERAVERFIKFMQAIS